MNKIFHRKDLAVRMAEIITSEHSGSGVFLSAPRRTGKSTFLYEDLIPELTSKNEVLYVDLWLDKSTDPAILIDRAINARLIENESDFLKLAKKVGVSQISVSGVKIDLNNQLSNITISERLCLLSDIVKKPIVLVIDEIQQSLNSDKGNNALFALKAARDELNHSKRYGFRLVATGSSRNKLAMLVNSKDQAFFCASLIDMPALADDFVKWIIKNINGQLKPSEYALTEVFKKIDRRPEYLEGILNKTLNNLATTKDNIDFILEEKTQETLDIIRESLMSVVEQLPAMQEAVFRVMVSEGNKFAPYRKETSEQIKVVANRLSSETIKTDESSIQYALEALRNKNLIWKSTRGVYMIEDSQYEKIFSEEAIIGHSLKP